MHQQFAVARAGIAGDGGTTTVGDHFMSRTIRDAAGRTVVIGDVVGGTTLPPRPFTVTGEVAEIDDSRVRVTVATASASGRLLPGVGAPVWLPARQIFLIHSQTPQTQQLRLERDEVTSMRWAGNPQALPLAAQFAGIDLIGAVETTDGWTLLLRASKTTNHPDLVPPGWFIVRPSRSGRLRACGPVQYAANFTPAAPTGADHTA